MVSTASPSHPPRIIGGNHEGSMAPLLATTGAETSSPGSTYTSLLAQSPPFYPSQSTGGSQKGLMAPSPTTTGAATPSASSARSSLLAWSPPSHPSRSTGGSHNGSMAPSPANTGASTPSMNLASPSGLTWSAPAPLTTTGGGGYCSRTPCHHDSPMLETTHLAPTLVHTTATESSPGIVLRRIGIRCVDFEYSLATSDPARQNLQPQGPPTSLPGLWTAITMTEEGTMNKASLSSPGSKE